MMINFVEENILTFVSLVLIIYISFNIPHVKHIFTQSTLNGIAGWDRLLIILFRISILLILFLYMIFIYLIKTHKEEYKDFSVVEEKILKYKLWMIPIGIISFVFSFWKFKHSFPIHKLCLYLSSSIILLYFWSITAPFRHKLDNTLSKYYAWISKKYEASIGNQSKISFSSISGGLSASALMYLLYIYKFGEPYYISSLLAIIIVFYGLWMLCARFFQNDQGKNLHEMIGRALIMIAICCLCSVCLWELCKIETFISYRNYSTWSLLYIFFLIVVASRILDAFPKKFVLLIACLVIAFSAERFLYKPIQVGKEIIPKEKISGRKKHLQMSLKWLEALQERIKLSENKNSKDLDPLIIVAAAGGGSRAALFASLVYEHLIKEKKEKNIILLSSVSGGSVASAQYYARSKKRIKIEPKAILKNSMPTEIKHYTLIKVKNEQEKEKLKKEIDYYIYNRNTDMMCADFLAPLLRGMLYSLSLERGECVAQFWKGHFEWGEDDNLSPHSAEAPLVSFNTTIIHEGKRLSIGFPQLLVDPQKLLREDFVDEDMESLSDNCPYYKISLSEAVRASANFPYVFEVAYVTRKGEKIYLTDGGVRDNTGFMALAHILGRIRKFATFEMKKVKSWREENKERLKKIIQKAKNIIRIMRKRGVLLVEIDSGAKPDFEKITPYLKSPIERPAIALDLASYTNAQLAKRRFERDIRNFGKIKIDSKKALFELSFQKATYTFEKSVITTWTLGPKDKGELFYYFAHGILGYANESPNLHSKISKIKRRREKLKKYWKKKKKFNSLTKIKEKLRKKYSKFQVKGFENVAHFLKNTQVFEKKSLEKTDKIYKDYKTDLFNILKMNRNLSKETKKFYTDKYYDIFLYQMQNVINSNLGSLSKELDSLEKELKNRQE